MNRIKLFAVAIAGFALAACDSGDINIAPVNTTDNSVGDNSNNNTGGGSTAGCASVTVGGNAVSGVQDAQGNCTYDDLFASNTAPIMEDLTFTALPGGAAHKFKTSLFIGQTHNTQADLDAAGITEGGDGPTLTIEAGAILAFETRRDFIIVNRGSQIVADGTARSPITITSISDVEGTLPTGGANGPTGARAVQQWGGIVINGFAVSNKCSYDGVRGETDFQLTPGTECSIEAEGSEGDDESQYGGDNDADSSGVLRYVVVKHTGAQVANGDELNGISFGSVGSGTVVENLQVYSTYDDGIEMFGGAVDVSNLVALYVRDDSIDIDEGYIGTISNALVIQQADDGDHCIEADGIGSYSSFPDNADGDAAKDALIAAGLNSRPTINNLTCIVSVNSDGTHSDGSGWRFREGLWPTVTDSQIISTFAANEETGADLTNNYCLRIQDRETIAGAVNGDWGVTGSAFSCQVPSRGANINGQDEQAWLESQGNQFAALSIGDGVVQNPTTDIDTNLALLEGERPVFSLGIGDVLIDGAASTVAPSGGFIGGIQQADDWTFPWAYGIDPANRGEPLWFE